MQSGNSEQKTVLAVELRDDEGFFGGYGLPRGAVAQTDQRDYDGFYAGKSPIPENATLVVTPNGEVIGYIPATPAITHIPTPVETATEIVAEWKAPPESVMISAMDPSLRKIPSISSLREKFNNLLLNILPDIHCFLNAEEKAGAITHADSVKTQLEKQNLFLQGYRDYQESLDAGYSDPNAQAASRGLRDCQARLFNKWIVIADRQSDRTKELECYQHALALAVHEAKDEKRIVEQIDVAIELINKLKLSDQQELAFEVLMARISESNSQLAYQKVLSALQQRGVDTQNHHIRYLDLLQKTYLKTPNNLLRMIKTIESYIQDKNSEFDLINKCRDIFVAIEQVYGETYYRPEWAAKSKAIKEELTTLLVNLGDRLGEIFAAKAELSCAWSDLFLTMLAKEHRTSYLNNDSASMFNTIAKKEKYLRQIINDPHAHSTATLNFLARMHYGPWIVRIIRTHIVRASQSGIIILEILNSTAADPKTTFDRLLDVMQKFSNLELWHYASYFFAVPKLKKALQPVLTEMEKIKLGVTNKLAESKESKAVIKEASAPPMPSEAHASAPEESAVVVGEQTSFARIYPAFDPAVKQNPLMSPPVVVGVSPQIPSAPLVELAVSAAAIPAEPLEQKTSKYTSPTDRIMQFYTDLSKLLGDEKGETTKVDKTITSDSRFEDYLCPIHTGLMLDPVTLANGTIVDRSSAEKWFAKGNKTCPVLPNPLQPLKSLDLYPAKFHITKIIGLLQEKIAETKALQADKNASSALRARPANSPVVTNKAQVEKPKTDEPGKQKATPKVAAKPMALAI